MVCDKISETNQEHASAGLGQMNVFVKIDVNPTAGIQNIFLFFWWCNRECLLRPPQPFPVFRIAVRCVVPHSRTDLSMTQESPWP